MTRPAAPAAPSLYTPDLSPLTRAYLHSWLTWVEAGAAPHQPYRRDRGLCFNAFVHDPDTYIDLRNDLRQTFGQQGLDEHIPFNAACDYTTESLDHICHLNPDRLAWVRANVVERHEDLATSPTER